MASKLLKSSLGPLGLMGIIANFGYHHQNYIKSYFRTPEQPEQEPEIMFEMPEEVEKDLDRFCKKIEEDAMTFPEIVNEKGVVIQGNFTNRAKNNLPDGQGIIRIPDQGMKMIGEFKSGTLKGVGTVYDTKNEIYYKGVFDGKHLNGLGIMIIVNELTYKGNFENSKPKGPGKYLFNNGQECVIKGAEKADQRDFAVCRDETKQVQYRGDWEDGIFQGKGKFFFKDGSYYEGDFANGELNGYGVLVDKYGDIQYKGVFREGKRQEFFAYYKEPMITVSIVALYLLGRAKL